MKYFYINQKLVNDIKDIFKSDWYLLGDSVFTSSVIVKGKIPWFEQHVERLTQSINDYYFQNTLSLENIHKLKNKIIKIEDKICSINEGYLRITFFLNEKLPMGYSPLSIDQIDCLWQINNSITEQSSVKCKTLELGNIDFPSYLKNGSYANELYWKRKVIRENFDDYIRLLNGNFLEASTSNIFFLLKNGSVVTPKVINGVLDGICRNNVVNYLKKNNYKVIEEMIKVNRISEIQEAFLTNSVKGIVPIGQIDNFQLETDWVIKLRNKWQWGANK